MRFSRAVERGRMLVEKPTPHSFTGCAMGMALAAVRGHQVPSSQVWPAVKQVWPWLGDEVEVDGGEIYSTDMLISSYFRMVCDGLMSFEEFLFILRQMEPDEKREEFSEDEEKIVPAGCQVA